MIFIILHKQFIYQIYCLPTLFDKEPNNKARMSFFLCYNDIVKENNYGREIYNNR